MLTAAIVFAAILVAFAIGYLAGHASAIHTIQVAKAAEWERGYAEGAKTGHYLGSRGVPLWAAGSDDEPPPSPWAYARD